ncbi:hypothetical protein ABPG74_016531 [Tetrahymena malaccensis]
MDIAFENQKQVQNQEDADLINNNKTYKLFVKIYSDIMLIILRFVLTDLVQTYLLGFNIFDYLIFDYLKNYLPVFYPYRILSGLLVFLVLILIIGFVTITFKSLYSLQNPMIFIKGFFFNYYQIAISCDMRKIK